jgi:hypothetical protein
MSNQNQNNASLNPGAREFVPNFVSAAPVAAAVANSNNWAQPIEPNFNNQQQQLSGFSANPQASYQPPQSYPKHQQHNQQHVNSYNPRFSNPNYNNGGNPRYNGNNNRNPNKGGYNNNYSSRGSHSNSYNNYNSRNNGHYYHNPSDTNVDPIEMEARVSLLLHLKSIFRSSLGYFYHFFFASVKL